MDAWHFALCALAGASLASVAGLRVFMPLFALSAAAKAGVLSLNENFAFLASDAAFAMLLAAMAAECAGYMVPYLDHLLDAASAPLAVAAGIALSAAVIPDADPALYWTLSAVAGGGAASLAKFSAASARAGTAAAGGGLANPLFSAAETVFSAAVSLMAVFAPVLAAAVLLALAFVVFKVVSKIFRARRGAVLK